MTLVVGVLATTARAEDDACRTKSQIYAQLETYGYQHVQFQGEKGGRLQATASDQDGNVSLISIDPCSGEVIRVKKQMSP